jgi:hypothetical protein
MERKPDAGAAAYPGPWEPTTEEKAAAMAGFKRELAAAIARWEELLVKRRYAEHELEGPAAEELDREIWRVVARMFLLAGAIGKAEGGEGRLPSRVLTFAGKQLEAALDGFVTPGLEFKKKGNTDNPYKRRAAATAVEYLLLVKEGYIDDKHPVKTVRQAFNNEARSTLKRNPKLLDWSTIKEWKTKYPPDGVLRRRIEQAERAGASGSRSEIARTILDEYAIGVLAKRTGF